MEITETSTRQMVKEGDKEGEKKAEERGEEGKVASEDEGERGSIQLSDPSGHVTGEGEECRLEGKRVTNRH